MNFKKIGIVLFGVMLISFGIGFYSLYYIDNFRLEDYLVGNSVIISEKDSTVKIDPEGILVQDGDKLVSISWKGIVVDDGNNKTTIGINNLEDLFNNINIGSTGKTYSEDYKGEFPPDDIKKISIDTIFVDANIYSTQSKNIIILLKGTYSSNKKFEFDFSKTNDTLNIISTPNSGSLTIANSNLKLDILIPEVTLEEIQFVSSSGDLSLKDLKVNYINFQSSSGGFTSNNTIANSFEIKSSSGDISIDPQNGTANLNSSSGDIDLVVTENTNNVKINSSSGNIRVINSIYYNGSISAATSSGGIFYENSRAPGNSFIIDKSGTNYFMDIKTSSGNINIE